MAFQKESTFIYLAVALICVHVATCQETKSGFDCSDASMNLTDMCPLLLSVYTTVEERTDYIKLLAELKNKMDELDERIEQLESTTEQNEEDLLKFCSSVQELCQAKGNSDQRFPDEEGCGSPVVQSPPESANSQDTIPGEWPWTVSLAIANNDSIVVACNGVLLDRRTVLTPAYCVKDRPKRLLQFGIYYKWGGDRYPVEARSDYKIIMHPEYDEVTNANNIAVLKLDSDLEYTERIQPVCLPTPETTARNLVPGNEGIVSGWQYYDEPTIRKTRIYVQSNDVCLKSDFERRDRGRIGPDMFCTKWLYKWFWNGSPLVFFDPETGRYTLEGLVSHFLGHNDDKLYEVFVRVSYFLDWIEKNMGS